MLMEQKFFRGKINLLQKFPDEYEMTKSNKEVRRIERIIRGVETSDGAGVSLKRILGSPELNMLDPFLLLDEFGSDNPDEYIAGFPPHPHRGFETVTYMLHGKFRHKDTAGNEGYLEDGSVQWMTAGRGVIHSEMPEQTEGLLRGFQLWINLPKEKKMIKPAYNDIPPNMIPTVKVENSEVKVISGVFSNTTGPGKPYTGVLYLDIKLRSHLVIPIDDGWNAMCYVYEGEMESGRVLSKGDLAVMSKNGSLECINKTDGTRMLLIAGKPLNEPVARGGPFVMNTKSEIVQAFEDFQSGSFGK